MDSKNYVGELSVVVTSHTSRLNIMIDLSLEKDAIDENYIGVKHSISEIDDNVNETLNDILADELSNSSVFKPNINLYSAGVEPNIQYNSINRRGDRLPCVSYVENIDINYKK